MVKRRAVEPQFLLQFLILDKVDSVPTAVASTLSPRRSTLVGLNSECGRVCAPSKGYIPVSVNTA